MIIPYAQAITRYLYTSNRVLSGDIAIEYAHRVADAAHADGVFHCVPAALHIAANVEARHDIACFVINAAFFIAF